MPGSPELHLTGFDGPMDLVLNLAERQRIDLGQISILQLVEQFVAAMEWMERHVALERRADWLVMAARLLLRSRPLFPASQAAEQDAARDAGIEGDWLDQILAVRAAAIWLERRPPRTRRHRARKARLRNPRRTRGIRSPWCCISTSAAPRSARKTRSCSTRRPASTATPTRSP